MSPPERRANCRKTRTERVLSSDLTTRLYALTLHPGHCFEDVPWLVICLSFWRICPGPYRFARWDRQICAVYFPVWDWIVFYSRGLNRGAGCLTRCFPSERLTPIVCCQSSRPQTSPGTYKPIQVNSPDIEYFL